MCEGVPHILFKICTPFLGGGGGRGRGGPPSKYPKDSKDLERLEVGGGPPFKDPEDSIYQDSVDVGVTHRLKTLKNKILYNFSFPKMQRHFGRSEPFRPPKHTKLCIAGGKMTSGTRI